MRRPPPRSAIVVAVDRHRARGREELLDAVLAHDELPVGIERALRPRWRDHVAFDVDPERHPFGVGTGARGTAATGDLLVDRRHDGGAVELEPPPAERLLTDEPQRSGAEDPRTPLLVGHGMGRLVGVRQQHPAARQREVQRGHLRGLPGGPDRLHRDTRETDLPLVVPDPHRRALAVRRHGRRCRRHFVGGSVEAPRHVDRHARSRLEPLNFPYSTAVISASSLVDRATADTGLDDFGMDGWQVGLEQLLAAAAVDLPDEVSRATIESAAARRLVTRLHIEQWYARAPRAGSPRRGPRDHRRPAEVGDDRAAPPAGARPAVPLPAGVGAGQSHAAARSRDRARRPAPAGRHRAGNRRPPHLRRRRPHRGEPHLRPALPRPGARVAAADLHRGGGATQTR